MTAESLAGLKSAFEWGDRRSTAGNSSGVGDGAALCILTTRERAVAEGSEIVGKYVASTFVGKTSSDVTGVIGSWLTLSARRRTSFHGYLASRSRSEDSRAGWPD